MSRYAVSVLPKADVNQVADSMRQAGATIIGLTATPNKFTSGRFLVECTEELATRLRVMRGVKYFEDVILHYPASR